MWPAFYFYWTVLLQRALNNKLKSLNPLGNETPLKAFKFKCLGEIRRISPEGNTERKSCGNAEGLRDIGNAASRFDINVFRVLEAKERENGTEEIFEKKAAENFSKLVKNIKSQIKKPMQNLKQTPNLVTFIVNEN